MLTKNNDWSHVVVLLMGMLACGLIAVTLGKELNWDLASYHLYNPLAFLQHRRALDNWPSEFIHIHLTPTADFITYYFITYLQPKTAVFLLGALHGMNVWLLYAIAMTLLSPLPRIHYPKSLALLLALLGMYGPMVIPGIGSFQHDALVSLLVLGFILAWLNNKIITGGLLLGVAAGLKLTAGIFVLGAMLSLLAWQVPRMQRMKLMLVVGISIGVGMLLTSGYWFVAQWQHYHNPLFPFMNSVFHSPDFPAYNWKDPRFLPTTWLQTLFYPFYFSFDGRTNDVPFRDFRFAILYVLLVAILLVKREPLQPRAKWLIIFFVLSYVIWQFSFSIMRYAMPLEMLAPLVIALLLYSLIPDAIIFFGFMLVVALFIFLSMYPSNAVRMPQYEGDYFNVSLPLAAQHTSHATVLMPISAYSLAMKPRPQTYLIAALPAAWRYVGIPFQGQAWLPLSPAIITSINHYQGRLFVMASSEYLPLVMQVAGLTLSGPCADITSDRQKISSEDVKLCPVKKLSFPIHRA